VTDSNQELNLMSDAAPKTLRVFREDSSVRLFGARRGPVPTVSISASPLITVEVDPSMKDFPVEIRVADLDFDAETALRDLLGSATVDAITASDSSGKGEAVPFVLTPTMEGILSLALLAWDERWNIFPLDPTLIAVDRLAAASRAGSLGARIARETLPGAQPALALLHGFKEHGALAPAATRTVEAALRSAGRAIPASSWEQIDWEVDLSTLIDSRMSTSGSLSANTVGTDVLGNPQSLHDTADWRLTGMGMASTAEDVVRAQYVHGRDDLVTITVPAQEEIIDEAVAAQPYYEGIITDAVTGEVLAFAHLAISEDGTRFTGTAPLARPLQITDIVDIRHPLVAEPVETDLRNRKIDRIRRSAARALAVERLAAGAPEATDLVVQAWSRVSAEISQAKHAFQDISQTLKGWAMVSESHRHHVLVTSPAIADQLEAESIEYDYASTGLEAVEETPLEPTLAELALTGRLLLASGGNQ
jgi:hypothetical protein